MADTNRNLHLKNLAKDAVTADPANPYQDWSPPTMVRAAKTAASESSATASPASSHTPEGGDRLNQINKAFSSAIPDDSFSADDIFSTEDAGTADPFLAYTKQGGDDNASSTLNRPSATAPQPSPIFVEEVEDAVADPIFAEPAAPPSAGAHPAEELGAQPFSSPLPSPQQQEEDPFDSTASLDNDGDEAGVRESWEGEFEPVPPQSTAPLPLEEADTALAYTAAAEAVPSDYASGETIATDPTPLSTAAEFSKPAQSLESPTPTAPASAPQDPAAAPTAAEFFKPAQSLESPTPTGPASAPQDPAAAPTAAEFFKPAQSLESPTPTGPASAPQDPAAAPTAAEFSKPAQSLESPTPTGPASAPQDPAAAPEAIRAPTLTLDIDSRATEGPDDPLSADGDDSETTSASESSGHYEPLPPAEPSGLRIEPLPEPQITAGSALEETTEGDQDHREDGDWGGLAQTPPEESRAIDSFAQDIDMSVDFSEELDTLKTQVDSLIASYNQVHQENSELKRKYAEAEESIQRYAEDCQRLRIENEQIKPLRTLNRELQEEVADVQREKRHYEGMVRNIRDKNREAASAMHKMIVRLGDIDPSS